MSGGKRELVVREGEELAQIEDGVGVGEVERK